MRRSITTSSMPISRGCPRLAHCTARTTTLHCGIGLRCVGTDRNRLQCTLGYSSCCPAPSRSLARSPCSSTDLPSPLIRLSVRRDPCSVSTACRSDLQLTGIVGRRRLEDFYRSACESNEYYTSNTVADDGRSGLILTRRQRHSAASGVCMQHRAAQRLTILSRYNYYSR